MKVAVGCSHCGVSVLKEAGAVNRASRSGLKVYCGRECSGLARRKWKSEADRRAEKKSYDAAYREKNAEKLKAKKAEYFRRTYDPAAAREARKLIMPRHVEYCRRPEYRVAKRAYDRVYRAKKDYGPLYECQLLVLDIRKTALSQMTDYEIRMSKGTFGKSQQRKRDYERSIRTDIEVGALGNLERGQRR